jgi:cell division transport system permease protein
VGGLQALDRLRSAWDRETRIVALLERNGAAPVAADAVAAAVRALAGAASVRQVSAADALADLARAIGPVDAGLARLPVNPVPARLEIAPQPGLSAAALRDLVDTVRQVPGIDTVEAALAWVAELERIRGALRAGGFALAAVLGAMALITMAGATTLARQRRLDESAVLRLAGVPEARLRMPLVLQATILGAAGGALGMGALALASEGGSPWLTGWLRASLGAALLPHPGFALGALLVGAAVALGLLGGLGSGRP